jgi:hypothetical protein
MHRHFIGISLAFHWHFIGISLAFHWHFIGISLAFHWHFMEVLALLKESRAKPTYKRGTIGGLTAGYLVQSRIAERA